ncbi:hypothetical protein QWA68_015691 [Fusarium oxysporum]|nr:hypothetical protein QWA68_015691 [Fusarium oxysporum]
MAPTWTHLIRFIAFEDGHEHLGQIEASATPDVGLALHEGKKVQAKVVTGTIFDGTVTDKVLHVQTLLSPIATHQVPLIRCMGLNYRDHAAEAKMPVPDVPLLFIKPRTAVCGPWPEKVKIPNIAQDGSSDYEAELAIIISRDGRDIPVAEAKQYVLGYTCSNDISARNQQFKNSQWDFSKGFDGSAPVGPVLVAPSAIQDPHQLAIRAIHNSNVVQKTNTREMIFNIAEIISFLSQGTTLEKGTVILTGTGPGIGFLRDPKIVLNHGDDMRVEIEKIGTLINDIYYE